MANKNYKFETLQLHVGQEAPDPATGARAVPIYQTTSYVFRDCAQAAARFGLAEGGKYLRQAYQLHSRGAGEPGRRPGKRRGRPGGSLRRGGHHLCYRGCSQVGRPYRFPEYHYGGTYNLLNTTLKAFGVDTTFVNIHDLDQVKKAVRPETKAIYLETLGNPNSDIPDIEALAQLAHKHQIPLIIDNTFGTPYLIRPIEHGADIVVHSATKFIGGHGTSLGGVIVDGGTFDWEASGRFPQFTQPNPSYHGVSFTNAAGKAAFAAYIRAILLRDTGASISPFNAFLLLQGLETLSLRLERHVENTLRVVEFLSRHPQVERVNHPSLSGHPDHKLYEKYFPKGAASIFTFEIKGEEKEAQAFIDHLELFSLLANVADVKSLVIHPATTTHAQLSREAQLKAGIRPNTIRLSIGTEHIDDILADLEHGFAYAK